MAQQKDELVLNQEDLGKELEQAFDDGQKLDSLTSETTDGEGSETLDASASSITEDADLEVPESSFWDETDNAVANAKEETSEEEQTTEETPDTDGEESTQPDETSEATSMRTIKANGKVYEVDMADEERVNQLLSLGMGARPAFSERDKLRKELTSVKEELDKFKSTFDKFEKMSPEKLYELKTGKPFDDAIATALERKSRYDNASEEERGYLDVQERLAQLEREKNLEKESWEKEKAGLAEVAEKAQLRELNSILHPEFHRHEFSSKVDDQGMAEELNNLLWSQTLNNIERKYGDDTEITPEIARQEFKRVAKLLDRNAAGAADKKVKQITAKKRSVAKKQAQIASTRNYNKNDVGKFSKLAGDPVALFRAMTRKQA